MPEKNAASLLSRVMASKKGAKKKKSLEKQ